MASVHRHTFTQLVLKRGWTRGAELGVDKGILFRQLLESVPALHLIGVDVCPVPERKAKCQAIEAQYAERATLLVMTTDAASALVEDGSLDFVFIDADHSYDAVMADIAHWQPKVRRGGWLGGHDYHPTKWPGVVQAVDQVFGRDVERHDGAIWGVRQ